MFFALIESLWTPWVPSSFILVKGTVSRDFFCLKDSSWAPNEQAITAFFWCHCCVRVVNDYAENHFRNVVKIKKFRLSYISFIFSTNKKIPPLTRCVHMFILAKTYYLLPNLLCLFIWGPGKFFWPTTKGLKISWHRSFKIL